uniref:Uncharacterized protein n=1 Tax=Cacopsylla melanoneura TaxID=428564 RepID=A0A8D8UQ54_9HEMI
MTSNTLPYIAPHVTSTMPYFKSKGGITRYGTSHKATRRRKLLTLFLTFKMLSSQQPPYLFEKYRFRSSVTAHTTRAHPLLLEIPLARTEAYHKEFLSSSISLWNSIPYPILNTLSFCAFKTLLMKAVGNKSITL